MTSARNTRVDPFTQPQRLPLRSPAVLVPPVLVVAPHPDDETLGCGGAIAALGPGRVTVLVISDGSQSHPNSRRYPAAALAALRAAETQTAVKILGLSTEAVSFLGLPDSAVPDSAHPNFAIALARCQSWLAQTGPYRTALLPYRHDPHPDHRATWELLHRALPRGVRRLEYPIWDWDPAQRGLGAEESAWRLDIQSHTERKQRAIAAYRSQLGLIDDDPAGFCLTPDLLEPFQRPWELYFDSVESAESAQIPYDHAL